MDKIIISVDKIKEIEVPEMLIVPQALEFCFNSYIRFLIDFLTLILSSNIDPIATKKLQLKSIVIAGFLICVHFFQCSY